MTRRVRGVETTGAANTTQTTRDHALRRSERHGAREQTRLTSAHLRGMQVRPCNACAQWWQAALHRYFDDDPENDTQQATTDHNTQDDTIRVAPTTPPTRNASALDGAPRTPPPWTRAGRRTSDDAPAPGRDRTRHEQSQRNMRNVRDARWTWIGIFWGHRKHHISDYNAIGDRPIQMHRRPHRAPAGLQQLPQSDRTNITQQHAGLGTAKTHAPRSTLTHMLDYRRSQVQGVQEHSRRHIHELDTKMGLTDVTNAAATAAALGRRSAPPHRNARRRDTGRTMRDVVRNATTDAESGEARCRLARARTSIEHEKTQCAVPVHTRAHRHRWRGGARQDRSHGIHALLPERRRRPYLQQQRQGTCRNELLQDTLDDHIVTRRRRRRRSIRHQRDVIVEETLRDPRRRPGPLLLRQGRNPSRRTVPTRQDMRARQFAGRSMARGNRDGRASLASNHLGFQPTATTWRSRRRRTAAGAALHHTPTQHGRTRRRQQRASAERDTGIGTRGRTPTHRRNDGAERGRGARTRDNMPDETRETSPRRRGSPRQPYDERRGRATRHSERLTDIDKQMHPGGALRSDHLRPPFFRELAELPSVRRLAQAPMAAQAPEHTDSSAGPRPVRIARHALQAVAATGASGEAQRVRGAHTSAADVGSGQGSVQGDATDADGPGDAIKNGPASKPDAWSTAHVALLLKDSLPKQCILLRPNTILQAAAKAYSKLLLQAVEPYECVGDHAMMGFRKNDHCSEIITQSYAFSSRGHLSGRI